MSLTTNDLIKIEELLNLLVGKRLDKLEKSMKSVKKDLRILKDGVAEIRHELDTEHTFRYQKLEQTALQTDKNTKDIKNIKQHLQIAV